MVAILNLLKKKQKLMPLCNIYQDNSFHFESDTVRANIFTGFLEPHVHLDEDGVIYFINASPEAHLGDQVRPADPGTLYAFPINGIHGFKKNGKAIVFHGFVPFKKAEGYEVTVSRLVPHPNGGDSIIIEYTINGLPHEPLVYGPDSNMTLGSALRALDYEIRKARGEDVNGNPG